MDVVTATPSPERKKNPSASFTLIELLVVMAIIAILAALILAAGNGVMQKGMRSRAAAEIQAMSTALESYKTDNGIYPVYNSSSTLVTNYSGVDPSTAAGEYQKSSQALYNALSGQVNFLDAPTAGVKSYMSFRANQVGNSTTPAGTGASANTSSFVKDPFNLSYGYSTGYATGAQTNYPFNGNGFFDLWSTGGKKGTTASNTNSFISNWQ